MVLNKNIKEYCAERKSAIKRAISASDFNPQFAIVQVGNVEASNRYIKHKLKDCEEVGIIAHVYHFDEDILTNELAFEVKDLNEHYDAVIVQLPLPKHINVEKIKMAINPGVDVDGFHPMTMFYPCTPLGIMEYLNKGCHFDLKGKNVTIIGRSDIVGKPLAMMMTDADATVTLCHSKTKCLQDHIENADLIVSAVGKTNFLNCYAIYKPVIDVSINFNENGKLVGDCFNTEGRDVTPVPGGVGLLTRVALLENICEASGIKVED